MPIGKTYFDQRQEFYRHLHFPNDATVGHVLRAYL